MEQIYNLSRFEIKLPRITADSSVRKSMLDNTILSDAWLAKYCSQVDQTCPTETQAMTYNDQSSEWIQGL
jgi:hypothetical protein